MLLPQRPLVSNRKWILFTIKSYKLAKEIVTLAVRMKSSYEKIFILIFFILSISD